MGNKILLSLCIPTSGVVEWIIPVIDSIYAQGVDNTLFEVVVTDNGDKDDLQEAVKNIEHENFHYYRTTSKGFTNQIDAFEKCSGEFCKMLNHRSKLISGSLCQLLDFVRKYRDTKPILYCAEGHAKGGEFIECENTDEFVKSLSYYVSWSAGTGAWRKDIKDVRNENIDNYFPHTVFLFGLRNESKYVIWNGKYENMTSDAGKGGYDVFYAFSVRFLDILNNLRIDNKISPKTFVSQKKELFNFLKNLYLNEVVLPTKHTFVIEDVCSNMRIYYGTYYYCIMIIQSWLKAPIVCFQYLSRKCLHI